MKIKEESGIKLLWDVLWKPDPKEKTMVQIINESDLPENDKKYLKEVFHNCSKVKVVDAKRGRIKLETTNNGIINEKNEKKVEVKEADKEIADN